MNKRIRYVTLPDGRLESMQIIKATDGREYKAQVNGNMFQIIDIVSGVHETRGNATSLHKAKIAAKQALIMLGCEFGVEKRKARTSEDTK